MSFFAGGLVTAIFYRWPVLILIGAICVSGYFCFDPDGWPVSGAILPPAWSPTLVDERFSHDYALGCLLPEVVNLPQKELAVRQIKLFEKAFFLNAFLLSNTSGCTKRIL